MVVSTVGYHWEEVFGAWAVFRDAGWPVAFFTVDGSPPKVEPASVKRTGPLSWFGYGVSASIAPETPPGRELSAQLMEARPLAELDADDVDVLYLPGGFGCMRDMNRDSGLHKAIETLHARGKVLSGVCHATSTFALAGAGSPIVAGRRLTGFPAALDQALVAIGAVHDSFLPLPLSNEKTLMDAGASISWWDRLLSILWPRYTRVDGPFVTGVGPKASRVVAAKIVGRFSRDRRPIP